MTIIRALEDTCTELVECPCGLKSCDGFPVRCGAPTYEEDDPTERYYAIKCDAGHVLQEYQASVPW